MQRFKELNFCQATRFVSLSNWVHVLMRERERESSGSALSICGCHELTVIHSFQLQTSKGQEAKPPTIIIVEAS